MYYFDPQTLSVHILKALRQFVAYATREEVIWCVRYMGRCELTERDVREPDLPGPDLPGPDLPGPDLPGPDLPGPDLPRRKYLFYRGEGSLKNFQYEIEKKYSLGGIILLI